MRPALLCLVLLLPAILRADLAEMDARFVKLPAAVLITDPRGVVVASFHGAGAKATLVPVAEQPFSHAQRIRTETKPPFPYSANLGLRNTAPVTEGDSLLGIVSVRAVELPAGEDEARTEFVFEKVGEPYTKSATMTITAGPRWEKFYIPFTARESYPAGGAQIVFRAGYDPQTIEIGGVQVVNFGQAVKRADLPYTPLTYKGRAADAPWRAAAAARIEQHRRGDLTVTVRDAAGAMLPGALVRVKMQRHAYAFGSAVDARFLLAEEADADTYRAIVARDFNRVVIENHFKWPLWINDRKTGPAALAWLRAAGLEVRGHCLVWPGKKNLPKTIAPLLDQPDALRRAIINHIADITAATRGQFVEWDVLNEPFTNTDVQKVLGEGVFAEWFKAARAGDPAARLFLNDYSIIATGGIDTAHQDHYFATIQALRDAGAPLDGIGIQGHFDTNLTPIPKLGEILDRFASFGLPIEITELDISVYDEQVQADYTRDFMTLIFSHAATSGILTWGFWEKKHWIPSAAHYRADWSLRPAGKAWYDLVFKDWWSPEQRGTTDARGAWKGRGFHGDYVVEVEHDGRKTSQSVRLHGAATPLVISLP